jgi:hypothetical protein
VVLYQQISSSSDEAIKAALGLDDEADKASRFPSAPDDAGACHVVAGQRRQ